MDEKKSSHGCLTAWLVLLIIGNSLTAILYLFLGSAMKQTYGTKAFWATPLLIIASILEVVGVIALFKRKKWGFYLYALTGIIAITISAILLVNIFYIFFGLLGIAMLYGVLHIGNKDNKGWTQLE